MVIPVFTLALAPRPRSPINPFRTFGGSTSDKAMLTHFLSVWRTLPPNSTLAAALTSSFLGLKCDGDPRLSDPKVRRPGQPLADRVASSYTTTGHFRGEALPCQRIECGYTAQHRSNRFRRFVCRDLSDVEVILVLCSFSQSWFSLCLSIFHDNGLTFFKKKNVPIMYDLLAHVLCSL